VPQLASSTRVGASSAAAEEVFADSLGDDGLPSLKEAAVKKPAPAPAPPPVEEGDLYAPPGEELEAVARAPSRVSRLQTPDAGVSLDFLDGSGVRIGMAVVVALLIGAVIVHSVFSGGGDEIADEDLAGLFLSSDEAKARLEAGKKKAAAGDHFGALRDLEDVLQADPDLVDVHLALSVSYEEVGMYDEAAEALGRYLDANPDAANADELRQRLVMLGE